MSARVEGSLLGTRMERMESARIPHPDSALDVVASNMVLEHMEDLALTATEVVRENRGDGEILCLFPGRGAWREGQSGIPFLHGSRRG